MNAEYHEIVICYDCKGVGEKKLVDPEDYRQHIEKTFTCPTCEGRGRLQQITILKPIPFK